MNCNPYLLLTSGILNTILSLYIIINTLLRIKEVKK